MIEGYRIGTLKGYGMVNTRVMGETDAWEGIIGENTILGEGILK